MERGEAGKEHERVDTSPEVAALPTIDEGAAVGDLSSVGRGDRED